MMIGLVLVLQDVGIVGKDEVDSGLVVIGKHEARIHEHHVVSVLEGGHVLTNTIKATQGDDLQSVVLLRHCDMNPFVGNRTLSIAVLERACVQPRFCAFSRTHISYQL